MISRKSLIVIVVLISSCHSGQERQAPGVHHDSVKVNTSLPDYESQEIWSMEFDTLLKDDRMVRLRQTDNITLTSKELVDILNNAWDNVQIQLVKISNDTIFIKIPNSEVLTQQMGTTGAKAFMSTTTFTLTELKGIRYVNFDFEEGDHAIPGTYERLDFKFKHEEKMNK